ncbi:MAG TPA: hypothetical protein VEW25_05565 [Allosphingosinicella sp.]|nr:hypothetical protein [Allosphingosinicella sp.]
MTRNLISCAAIAAALALSACGEPETVGPADNDPQKEALAKATPKQLPPSIQVSRVYRCHDNSLVYVDFYTNQTAQVRTSEGGTPTMLTTPDGTSPYVAEGFSVGANAARTSITVPGRGSQTCNART